MIGTPVTTRHLYEKLCQQCHPFTLTGPWSALPVDDDVRVCPQEIEEIFTGLAGKFTADQLIRAGIAEKKALTLIPSTALNRPGSPLVFLRPDPTGKPVEVLTWKGTLSGRRLPLIASLRELRTLDALDTNLGDLLLASTIEDMVVLRALGLPASLAFGLDTVDAKTLKNLKPLLGWTKHSASAGPSAPIFEGPSDPLLIANSEPPAVETSHAGEPSSPGESTMDPPAPAAEKPGLILVAWSPSQLLAQEPAGLDSIRAHLRFLKEGLKIENMEVGQWVPSAEFLLKLKTCAQYNFLEDLAEDLEAEIEESNCDALLIQPQASLPMPPSNYFSAWQKHVKTLKAFNEGQASREAVKKADVDYQERLATELIEPLYSPTAAPATRNLQAALAQVSYLAHQLGPLTQARLSQIQLMGNPISAAEIICSLPLRQLLALIKTQIQISRELRS